MSLFPQHPSMRPLPYRKPTEGRDYRVVDDALPNIGEVRKRCLAKADWEYGYPTTGEVCPGMRAARCCATTNWLRSKHGCASLSA